MKKISPNDLCPCMSGKKYKFCCRDNYLLKDLEEQGYIYYNENYILSKIMVSSTMFRNFYEAERNKIKKEILWLLYPKLTSLMSYGHCNTEDKPYLIFSKFAPILIDNEIDTAHELQHLICCEKGYKTVTFKEGYDYIDKKLYNVISDMVNDPIVNGEIKKYGYDLLSYYKRADEIQKSTIGIHNISRLPYPEKVFIITLYVKKTLDMRNIYPGISDEEIDFNQWIISNYPQLASASKQILKIADEIGYDTPDKTETIFKKVINLFGLSDELKIE